MYYAITQAFPYYVTINLSRAVYLACNVDIMVHELEDGKKFQLHFNRCCQPFDHVGHLLEQSCSKCTRLFSETFRSEDRSLDLNKIFIMYVLL